MCNSCRCDDMDKCSIRGNAPVGWCCSECTTFNPLDVACVNKFEITKTRECIVLKDFLLVDENF